LVEKTVPQLTSSHAGLHYRRGLPHINILGLVNKSGGNNFKALAFCLSSRLHFYTTSIKKCTTKSLSILHYQL